MGRVLGRVTGAVDVPRGPDVLHRIHVPSEWFGAGATVEFELPRNLTCAACEGGGCGACNRSGAISLRGRKDPAETVRVVLPPRPEAEEPPSSNKRGLVMRIPERGGPPPEDSPGLPRGLLLLSVLEADESDPGVRRIVPSEAAPAPPPASVRPASGARRIPRAVLIGIVVLILWILLLVWLRLTGRG